jgi:hypothetical protein
MTTSSGNTVEKTAEKVVQPAVANSRAVIAAIAISYTR